MVESEVHKWSLFCLTVKNSLRSTWFSICVIYPFRKNPDHTSYTAINNTILIFFPLSLVRGHYSALLLHLTALLLVLLNCSKINSCYPLWSQKYAGLLQMSEDAGAGSCLLKRRGTPGIAWSMQPSVPCVPLGPEMPGCAEGMGWCPLQMLLHSSTWGGQGSWSVGLVLLLHLPLCALKALGLGSSFSHSGFK